MLRDLTQLHILPVKTQLALLRKELRHARGRVAVVDKRQKRLAAELERLNSEVRRVLLAIAERENAPSVTAKETTDARS